MDLPDLVRALLARDALAARQWVADAARTGVDWSTIPRPNDRDPTSLAVAAGIVELLAERAGQHPPPWTASVAAAPEPVWLVRSAATLPRLRRLCEDAGPVSMRRRRVYAPPDFLTAA